MAKKPKKRDTLAELLVAAPPRVLTDLVLELAAESPVSLGSASNF